MLAALRLEGVTLIVLCALLFIGGIGWIYWRYKQSHLDELLDDDEGK